MAKKPATPFGYCIFCDDVRQEVGNKQTLVGVYSAEIAPPAFPLVLNKFAAVAYYHERPDESTEPVQLKLQFPPRSNPEKIEPFLPMDQVRGRHATLPQRSDDPLFTFAMVLQFGGLVINEPGLIELSVSRGDLEISLGSLRVLPVGQSTSRVVINPAEAAGRAASSDSKS